MKLTLHGRRKHREAGSVLMLSLFFTAALGITLGSFLLITSTQHTSAMRSQSWHRAMTYAEAGIEEGLAQLNADGISLSSGTPAPRPPFGPVTRKFSDGSYDLFITGGATPTIYATGYVSIPALSAKLSRAIAVTTTDTSLFTTAVAAKSNIVVTSSRGKNPTFTDSFDSLDPQLKTKANGEVACLSGTLSIGSSRVNGNVLLGPSASASANLVAGAVSHNLNVDFPDVVAPPPSWVPATVANQPIDGINYRYIFKYDGEYTLTSSSGTGGIYVGPGAHVKLRVPLANFDTPAIYVAGTGSHSGQLLIFALQPGFSLNGDAVVESGNAANLVYLGTSGNTSLTLNNNSTFTGTIYAPAADFTENVISSSHNHSTKATFTGSCIAKSVKVNGTATFHFDENLLRDTGTTPLNRPLVVSSWREL